MKINKMIDRSKNEILFAAGARGLGFPSKIGFLDVVDPFARKRCIRHLQTRFAFQIYS
ncbi:hypothetical protein LEP1GSC060_1709 [Leptospira weilii serovar Ranarum str. ICFT]|uniref:Uncharacterized protein n=1 Tax=Leptospira weilii serovar Ranarum str. ICFT TaxID=1218598 RepID=N1WCZ0_9LEPT|nr:hypothetical protein [Leptospira weilii]EMY78121.1 hypothetical protein LEP1GSC060_1709 [Leptospira weilii serovar Ranarum str. ICFT]